MQHAPLIALLACGPNTPGFNGDMELAHELAEIGVILLTEPLHVLAALAIIVVAKPMIASVIMRAQRQPARPVLRVAAGRGQDIVLAGALLAITLNPFLHRLLVRAPA
jgi:predicted Kef-type K+ transport protein